MSAPTEPGFYWRRVVSYDDGPMRRWEPAEVYRRGGDLKTNGHDLDGIVWGPRLHPPPEPT